MRNLYRILLTLSVLGIPGGFLAGADQTRIAVTNPNMSFLPSGVALKKGFFKDEGLEVEIIRMNVPTIITALVTGDIGYTLLFGSVVRGVDRVNIWGCCFFRNLNRGHSSLLKRS